MQLTELYKKKLASDTFAWMVVVRITMVWLACIRIVMYKHERVFMRVRMVRPSRNVERFTDYVFFCFSLLFFSAFFFVFSVVACCHVLNRWMVCELTNSIFVLFLVSV